MPRIKKTASSSFVKGEEVFDDENGERILLMIIIDYLSIIGIFN